MIEYSGKAKTIEDALRAAAQAAMEGSGPDTMVHYTLKEVKGLYGGIAGFDEKEVTIRAEEPIQHELCGDVLVYKAYQSKKAILLIAHGTHPTAGYRVWLERKPIDVYPPRICNQAHRSHRSSPPGYHTLYGGEFLSGSRFHKDR